MLRIRVPVRWLRLSDLRGRCASRRTRCLHSAKAKWPTAAFHSWDHQVVEESELWVLAACIALGLVAYAIYRLKLWEK